MSDGDVNDTHSSSIPVNITLKINQNATWVDVQANTGLMSS